MVDNVYSLLGQATTDEYRRRRKEERKYRRDLERDRSKATLLGAVLNPVMGSITQGITQGIANKFGDRLEAFQGLESYRNESKDINAAYSEKDRIVEKFINPYLKSGKTSEQYFNENVLPMQLEDEVNQGLIESGKYAPNTKLDDLFGPNPETKNLFLRGLSQDTDLISLQDRKDRFKTWQEVVSATTQLRDKGDWDAYFISQAVDAYRVLVNDFDETGRINQALVNKALEGASALEKKYFQKSVTSKKTSMTVSGKYNTVIEEKTEVVVKHPFLVKQKDGSFKDETTVIDIKKYETLAEIRAAQNRFYDSDNYMSVYKLLSETGVAQLEKEVNTAFENGTSKKNMADVMSGLSSNWLNWSNKDIEKQYELLGKVSGVANFKSESFSDIAMEVLVGLDDLRGSTKGLAELNSRREAERIRLTDLEQYTTAQITQMLDDKFKDEYKTQNEIFAQQLKRSLMLQDTLMETLRKAQGI